MNWPGEVRHSCFLRSLIISRIHSSLFWHWRRTVSSEFFDIQVPSVFTEELMFARHAWSVLSRLCCNGHSFLINPYFSRIGRSENPSFSACGYRTQDISHLILHYPATDSSRLGFCRLFLFLRPLVHALKNCTDSGVPPCFYASKGTG